MHDLQGEWLVIRRNAVFIHKVLKVLSLNKSLLRKAKVLRDQLCWQQMRLGSRIIRAHVKRLWRFTNIGALNLLVLDSLEDVSRGLLVQSFLQDVVGVHI